MSKLSEILGVPENKEFKFYGHQGRYKVIGKGLCHAPDDIDVWELVILEHLFDMIENPELIIFIPEKPQLTDQQITAIKGRIAEGTPWAARNKYSDNTIYFFPNKPRTNSAKTSWHAIERTDLVFVTVGSNKNNLYDFITFDNSPVYLPDLIEGSEGE